MNVFEEESYYVRQRAALCVTSSPVARDGLSLLFAQAVLSHSQAWCMSESTSDPVDVQCLVAEVAAQSKIWH